MCQPGGLLVVTVILVDFLSIRNGIMDEFEEAEEPLYSKQV